MCPPALLKSPSNAHTPCLLTSALLPSQPWLQIWLGGSLNATRLAEPFAERVKAKVRAWAATAGAFEPLPAYNRKLSVSWLVVSLDS